MMTSHAAITSNLGRMQFDSSVFMVRERDAIEKLRNNIRACAKDLQEACCGGKHVDEYHFLNVMSLLQAGIMSCQSCLEGAWFSGFIRVGMDGKREMVTTAEIRQVSNRSVGEAVSARAGDRANILFYEQLNLVLLLVVHERP